MNLTRAKLIQAWFFAVGLGVVAAIAAGASVTVGTAALLFGLCLVPPVIVLLLWPGVQPPTAGEVLRGDRRP